MTKKYKVWVEIEEIDEEQDTYETLEGYGHCSVEFDTLDEAVELVSNLDIESFG